jgi:hypothetical protein
MVMFETIYDVGMHNGDDRAYYLAKGYKVVGSTPIRTCARAVLSVSLDRSKRAK